MPVILAALAITGTDPLTAQGVAPTPRLLTELAPGTAVVANDSKPAGFVVHGNEVFFSAFEGTTGRELYRTNNAGSSGAQLVGDRLPGMGSSRPGALVSSGGLLFFAAKSAGPFMLVASDGTAAGEVQLATLLGFRSGHAVEHGYVTTGLFPEWTYSDGTVAGTGKFDLTAGIPGAFVAATTPGTDAGGQRILWCTSNQSSTALATHVCDGSAAGTRTVATWSHTAMTEVRGQAEIRPGELAILIEDTTTGIGTLLRADEAAGSIQSIVTSLAPSTDITAFSFDQRALFAGIGATRIAATDGTSLVALSVPSVPLRTRFVGTSQGVLFALVETGAGKRLWSLAAGSNGFTDLGAVDQRLLLDAPTHITSQDLFAFVDLPSPGSVLVRIDLATLVTQPIADAPDAIADIAIAEGVGGDILFAGTGGGSIEPWRVSAVTGTASQIADVFPDDIELGHGTPRRWAAYGRRAMFVGDDAGGTRRLWLTDGTAAGTSSLTGLPAHLADELFEIGGEIWLEGGQVFDPSSLSLQPLVSGPRFGARFGLDALAHAGGGYLTDIVRVGRSGSTDVLGAVTNHGLPTAHHVLGEYAIVARGSIAITDGTTAGTTFIGSLHPSQQNPTHITAFDGRAWITADGFMGVQQIWSTSGGSVADAPIAGGPVTAVADGRLFTTFGDLLVALDPAGNVTTATVSGGPTLKLGGGIAGGMLAGSVFGLWISDGTQAGTTLLASGPIGDVFVVGRELAFFVRGAAGSREFWRTDGTVAGTSKVQDLEVLDGAVIHGTVFLTVDDPLLGREPYAFRPEVVNQPIGDSCSGHPTGTCTLRTDVDPRVGRRVELIGRSRYDGAGVGSAAALLIGSPALLPTDLPPSNCRLHLDPFRQVTALALPVDAEGEFTQAIDIPPVAGLIGLEVMFQAVVAPSPGPLGLEFTNGLLWIIGS